MTLQITHFWISEQENLCQCLTQLAVLQHNYIVLSQLYFCLSMVSQMPHLCLYHKCSLVVVIQNVICKLGYHCVVKICIDLRRRQYLPSHLVSACSLFIHWGCMHNVCCFIYVVVLNIIYSFLGYLIFIIEFVQQPLINVVEYKLIVHIHTFIHSQQIECRTNSLVTQFSN